ncbi:putative Divergent CRAL/TRIO domain containing protein [Blattamonas nauphoetae]|uniref:Divergent CRAL/TRIO domain containing protein n=1 Tax=Blattamonas nauphoetae TaxID=2049346 RepID=A0ABQ9XZD2_9EUKA|nr:putative Divergent CRAL/TRIO domain containing protein [Blattamonas nauphoetae]
MTTYPGMYGSNVGGLTASTSVIPKFESNENLWIIPDSYYSLLSDSMKMDFSSIHWRNGLYLSGHDFDGNRIVVITPTYITLSVSREYLCKYWVNKMDHIKFQPYAIFMDCSQVVQDAALPLLWNVDLYRSLPYAFKKNLKRVVIVNATAKLRMMAVLMRPFVSHKFFRKVSFVDKTEDFLKFAHPDQLQLHPALLRPNLAASKPSLPKFWLNPLPEQRILEEQQLLANKRVIPAVRFIPSLVINLLDQMFEQNVFEREDLFSQNIDSQAFQALANDLLYDPLHLMSSDLPDAVLTSLLRSFLQKITGGLLPKATVDALKPAWEEWKKSSTSSHSAILPALLTLPAEHRSLFSLLISVIRHASLNPVPPITLKLEPTSKPKPGSESEKPIAPASIESTFQSARALKLSLRLLSSFLAALPKAEDRWIAECLAELAGQWDDDMKVLESIGTEKGVQFPAPFPLADLPLVADLLRKFARHLGSPSNITPFNPQYTVDDNSLYIFAPDEVRRHRLVPLPKLVTRLQTTLKESEIKGRTERKMPPLPPVSRRMEDDGAEVRAVYAQAKERESREDESRQSEPASTQPAHVETQEENVEMPETIDPESAEYKQHVEMAENEDTHEEYEQLPLGTVEAYEGIEENQMESNEQSQGFHSESEINQPEESNDSAAAPEHEYGTQEYQENADTQDQEHTDTHEDDESSIV